MVVVAEARPSDNQPCIADPMRRTSATLDGDGNLGNGVSTTRLLANTFIVHLNRKGDGMWVDRFIRLLLPRQDQFFNLLSQIATAVAAAADVFVELVDAETPQAFLRIAEMMRRMEHDCDELAHQLYEQLDKTFVTPIDREDLASLTSSLDDVLDCMEHCAAFVYLYKIKQLTPEMKELVRITQRATQAIVAAFSVLRRFGEPAALRPFIILVNSLENDADLVYRQALADLFAGELDAKELIRQRDVLFALEEGVDACEDVIDVIRSVVVKNG